MNVYGVSESDEQLYLLALFIIICTLYFFDFLNSRHGEETT